MCILLDYIYDLILVLYGSETWSVTVREEHRLRMFENRVLRKIFGPENDEVTGDLEEFKMGKFLIFTDHRIEVGLDGW